MDNEEKMGQNEKKKSPVKGIIISLIAATIIIGGVVIYVVKNNSEDFYRIVKVIETDGISTVERKGKGEFEIFAGLLLQNNDHVETKENSSLYMQLDEDKFLRAESETVFKLEASGKVDDQDTKTKIVLEKGAITNIIEKPLGENETYEVETPTVSMAVRGTEFYVLADYGKMDETDTECKLSEIQVTKGCVEVYKPKSESAGSVEIPEGYMLVVSETDEDLSALKPWPIGEEKPASEEEPEGEESEEVFIEFDFTPDDFTFDGIAVSPSLKDTLMDRYAINVPLFDGIIHSADGKYEYTPEYNHIAVQDSNDEYVYYSIAYFKEDSVELAWNSDQPEEIKSRFSSPIQSRANKDEIYRIFHVEEVKKNENKFTCNWSDNVYMLLEGDNNIQILEMGNGNILRFAFDESGNLHYWYSISPISE